MKEMLKIYFDKSKYKGVQIVNDPAEADIKAGKTFSLVEGEIRKKLLDFGFAEFDDGYYYLIEVLKILHSKDNLINIKLKEVYEQAAVNLNVDGITSNKVLRGIRHYKEKLFIKKNIDLDLYKSLFPNNEIPYNTTFLASLNEWLKLK